MEKSHDAHPFHRAKAHAGRGAPVDAHAVGENQLVKVIISTSRNEVTSDGGYGVFADLQNLDTAPLMMRASETKLVIQPEVGHEHRRIIAVEGFYPTEEQAAAGTKPPVSAIVL
jgi:hypothetical protein